MSGWTYAKSGVNIDQKSSAIKALVDEISATIILQDYMRSKNL